ncbi:MAG: TlpA family protein disulfide reductase [Colwelliaceae bacterium]|nr:TlpA family protein disulfide reductase [Colwelliaceae bacterium]
MKNFSKIIFSSHHKYIFFILSLFVGSCHAETINQLINEKNDFSEYQGKDWTLTSVTGEEVTLSNYQGKPVILVFWATWCPYCKKLLPGIAKLNEKYEKKGLKVIAVNIKEDWKPEIYWKNHGYKFDAVLAGDSVAEIYGVKGTPGIVFIAPSGEVLKVTHFSDPEHPSLEKFTQHFLP